MTEANEVNVYWAPAVSVSAMTDEPWVAAGGQFPYQNPKSLQSELMKEKNPNRGPSTFLSCPAAVSTFTRTVVFKNNRSCSYEYDLTDEKNLKITPKDERYLNCTVRRPPALNEKPTIEFQLRWIFFSEEPLIMSVTPPMFHPPKYTRYATAVPGQYDIGRWFRPFVFEVQTWEPKGKLSFEDDEPLFYATFNTDKKVNLHRFVYTDKLLEYASQCTTYYTNEKSMEKRYELFDSASMNYLVLQEIKNNLVG
jgi:hypothetical protein